MVQVSSLVSVVSPFFKGTLVHVFDLLLFFTLLSLFMHVGTLFLLHKQVHSVCVCVTVYMAIHFALCICMDLLVHFAVFEHEETLSPH